MNYHSLQNTRHCSRYDKRLRRTSTHWGIRFHTRNTHWHTRFRSPSTHHSRCRSR